MASVRLSQLNKIYAGGTHAVRDVNLQVAQGECLVLIGPSGCGKTTILRMIAGLEQVSSGDIFIHGQRVNDLAPASRDIAMVFQDYALYPHMSVRQNLAFGLRIRRVAKPAIARAVRQAAEILAIEDLLDRRPPQLSGGQCQRVALGRAIVRDPRLFLFDEPLANLDAQLRVQMRTEIARLHRRLGTTTIYVTHDQVEAMTLGDRITVMREGVVQQVDTPLAVYQRPANLFVAGFIGSPSMNFIEGQVAGGRFVYGNHTLDIGQNVPDGPAILGIRPEHILADGQGSPFAEATLEFVEHTGRETMGYFDVSGQTLVARLPGDRPTAPGDTLHLSLCPETCHLFAANGDQQRLN